VRCVHFYDSVWSCRVRVVDRVYERGNLQLARASQGKKKSYFAELSEQAGRIVRQLVTESVLLALIGQCWSHPRSGGNQIVRRTKAVGALHGAVVTIDSTVFGFPLILSLLTGFCSACTSFSINFDRLGES